MQVYDPREEYQPAINFFRRCNVRSHEKVAHRFVIGMLIAGACVVPAMLLLRGM